MLTSSLMNLLVVYFLIKDKRTMSHLFNPISGKTMCGYDQRIGSLRQLVRSFPDLSYTSCTKCCNWFRTKGFYSAA